MRLFVLLAAFIGTLLTAPVVHAETQTPAPSDLDRLHIVREEFYIAGCHGATPVFEFPLQSLGTGQVVVTVTRQGEHTDEVIFSKIVEVTSRSTMVSGIEVPDFDEQVSIDVVANNPKSTTAQDHAGDIKSSITTCASDNQSWQSFAEAPAEPVSDPGRLYALIALIGIIVVGAGVLFGWVRKRRSY